MTPGVRSSATAVERDSRAFFTLSMRAMEGGDPLRPSALRALLLLDGEGPTSVGQLAVDLGLSQSATSRLVDRLVHQGLVDRTEDLQDRRQFAVGATPAGRAVVERLVTRRRSAVLKILAVMEPADRRALQHGLAAFSTAARGA